MNRISKLNKNQSGQAALEAAIILIAFVVVASVFAFAILSAGSASTQKGESAIYSGLANVQSSLEMKGAVIAQGDSSAITDLLVDVATVAGGSAVNLDPTTLVVAYHDATQNANNITPTVTWILPDTSTPTNNMLVAGAVAELDIDLTSASTPVVLATNTAFTIEIKPSTGGTLVINRTTPAALEDVMELR